MKPHEINETKAIQLAIRKMEQTPLTIAQFIQAVTNDTYKSWNVYRIALSEILGAGYRGRSVPKRKHMPKHNNAFKFGLAYEREKAGDKFIPQLPLHKCRTVEEKLTLINNADCSVSVKADLVAGIFS